MGNIFKKVMVILVIAFTCTTNILFGQLNTAVFTLDVSNKSTWVDSYANIEQILLSATSPFYLWSTDYPTHSSSSSKVQVTLVVNDESGSDNGSSPFATIAAAISAASAGDIIDVTGGSDSTHTEAGITISKNLTIQGQGQTTTFIQADVTFNTASDRVFSVSSGVTVIFQNLTIRYGKTTGGNDGAGIRIFDNTNVTLTNVSVDQNVSGNDGGGIMYSGSTNTSSLTMTECIFTNNQAGAAGGGWSSQNEGTISLTNCIFDNNTAGTNGGSTFVNASNSNGSVYTFTNCSFVENTATGDGAGLSLAAGSFTLKNCTIYNNTAGGHAGGLRDPESANQITLINCTVANNTATVGNGGGLWLTDNGTSGSNSLINSIVANNTAIGLGNDVYFDDGTLGTNTNNLVESCDVSPSGTCPTFMITSDPMFSAASNCANGQTYIPISVYSPARDMGTTTGNIPTTDICSGNRYNTPDLGSYDNGSVGRDADSLALVDFYTSTNGGSWTTSTNWLTANPIDTWHGVTINNNRVTKIIMSSNNLTGSLPVALNLDTLLTLSLSSNNLTGGIPNFTNATKIKTFSLQNNSSIGGTIPDFSNLTQLQSIYFNNCGLTGSIPSNLLTFPNLTFVVLSSNTLSGSIPSFTQNTLEWLLLGDNGLTGNIPNFSGLTTLTTLELHNNSLDGSLPNFNMAALTTLNLTSNSLSGIIPDLNQMPNLTTLKLGENSFSGAVPNFTNLGNLATLQIHSNSLDSLPTFSSTPVLSTMEADYNNFTFDDLVPNIANITTVQYNPQDSILTDTSYTIIAGTNALIDIPVDEALTNTSYQWYKGASTDGSALSHYSRTFSNFSVSDTGTYYVQVTNTSAPNLTLYTRSIQLKITCPTITANAVTTNISCNGLTDGSINLTVSGGNSPYTYNWDNEAGTNEDPSNLAGNTYNVTITDNTGCTATTSATISEPSVIGAGATFNNVSCNGGSDGNVNITTSGGTSPYTYNWSNTTTNENLTNVTAGNYDLTITDANSCTKNLSFTITEPSDIAFSLTMSDVSCNGGNDGAINLTVSGGTSPYFYSWDNGAGTNQNPSGLSANTYSVTITDNRSCTKTTSITINEPSILSLSTTSVNVNCNGGTDGSINLTVSGGTSPYTYAWDNGAGTNEDPSNLGANTYSVTVTDANSCTATTSATITEPTAISLSTTQVNVSGNGLSDGSIDLTVSGGTSPYTYNWANGAGTNQDPTGLAANTYSVTVTDNNSCTQTTSITITEPNSLSLTFSQTNVTCNSGTNGSIDLTVSGGTSPYTYAWNNGAGTNQDPTGLAANTYIVTVTDNNSITATTSVTITEPTAISLSTTQINVSGNGLSDGSINLTVSGGTSPYTYNWDNGAGTNQDPTGLAANTYSVTVTDNNSCTQTTSITITEPNPLSLTFSQTNVTCNSGTNGSIDLTVSGGTSPYTYAWNNGAGTNQDPTGLAANTYIVTVTDNNSITATTSVTITEPTAISLSTTQINVSGNGLSDGSIDLTVSGGTSPYTYNWDNGAGTNQDPTGLAANTYSVTVTDNNSCTQTTSITITEPNSLSLTFSQTNVTCNSGTNGSIDLTVSGGTSPYTYAWNNGAGTNQDPTGLAANTYIVTVTDNNSITATTSVTITEPTAISLSLTQVNVTCNSGTNGSIDLTVSGGISPYTYVWDNGAGTNEDLSNLTANTYSVTVTDANSCTAITNATISEPSEIGISATFNNVSCNGGNDGNVNLTTSGGTSPYTYNWSNTTTNEDLTNVTAGNYDVTITDANSCTKNLSFTITEPSDIAFSLTMSDVSCNGGNDGAINLTVSGGTSPYFYSWDNGAGTNQDPSGLSANTYAVTITDNRSCTKTASVTISEPSILSLSATPTNATCSNLSDGSIDLTVSGGTSPFTYSWNNGAGTNEDPSSLAANTYSVTVTDNKGCTANTTSTISNTFTLATSSTLTNVTCNGFTDGSIDLTLSGGTSPYIYNWDNGAGTNEDPSSLGANTYSVTVTDNNGCIINTNAVITEPTALTVSMSESQQVLCLDDGKALATPSGGTSPYTYQWDANAANQTTQEATGLSTGTYTVTVTDAKNCTITNSQTITSNTSASCTDSLTLVILYNSTSGASWTTTWNLNNSISTWHGITIDGSNRVTHIDLTNNNLQGEIPIEMNNLTNLQSLKLSNNSIIALAFLTPLTSLTQLHVDNNQLTFEDVIKNISVTDYQYSPQATVDITQVDTVAFGAPHFLEANIDFGRTDNNYEWFRDGNSIGTTSSNQFLIPSVSSNNGGNYTYQATNTNAPALTLSSNPLSLLVIEAGNDTSICLNNGAFNLAGSPSGGTWSGTGITNTSTGTFDPSVAGVGTHLISYTVGSTIDFRQITVFGLPTVEAGNDFVSCNGLGNVILSGYSPIGGTWSGTGITDPTTGIFNTTTAGGIGTYTLTYTFTNSTTGCFVSDTRTVNVTNGTPVTVNADDSVCINDSPVTLTANVSGGVWNGTGVNAVSGQFNPVAAGAGVHSIIYFYGVSPCQTSDTVVMTVQNVSVSIIENDFTVCDIDANPITLTASQVGGSWSGVGIDASGTFTPNNVSIPVGVNHFYYSYTDPTTNCTAIDSIAVTKASCSVFAGLDKTVCINDGVTSLSGSPTGGTWSGTGIVDAVNGIFDPSVASVGSFTLTYTVGSTSDDMIMTVSALPVVNAVDTTVCNNPINFTLEGLPNGGLWLSGSGLVNASGTYNTVVGGGTDSIQYAVYEYTDVNGCKNTNIASITVIEGDVVSAGADEFTCLIANTYQLLNATPTGGIWSGPGIISNTNTVDLSIAGLGIHTYTYTAGTGTCQRSDMMQLSVTNNVTLVVANDSLSVCQGVTNLQLPVASPAGGVWTGAGIVDGTQGIFSTQHSGVANVPGDYILEYVYDGGTPCEKRINVKVSVFKNPEVLAYSVDTALYCLGTTAILNHEYYHDLTNITTQWMPYQGSTNLIDPIIGNIDITNADTGSYILTLTDTISGCISKDTLGVIVEAFNAPILAAADAIVCKNEEVILYVADTSTLNFFLDTFMFVRVSNAYSNTILNDTLQVSISDSLIVPADSNYLNNGDRIQVLKIDMDGCFAFSNIVQITIDTVPNITLINQSPNNCFGEELTFSIEAGATFTTLVPYVFSLDNTIVQGGSSSIYKNSILPTGNHQLIAQFENDNGCKNRDTLLIEVDSLPSIILTVNDDIICTGDNSIFTATSDITGSTFDYFINDNFETTGLNTYSSSFLTNNDIVEVHVTSPKGCIDSANIQMQVDTFPVIDIRFVSTDTLNMLNDTLCLNQYVTLEANISGSQLTDTTWTSTTSPNTVFENTLVSPARFDFDPFSDTITGWHYLTLMVETEGGCISTDIDSILVKPLPEGPEPYSINDSLLVCSKDTIQLVFQNPNNSTDVRYFWGVNNFGTIGFSEEGEFEGDSTFVVPINASGVPNTASVYGYADLNGCRNLDDFDYSLDIIVKPKPVLLNVQDYVYCSEDSILVDTFQTFPNTAIVTWTNNPTGTNAFTLNALSQLAPTVLGIDSSIIATIEVDAMLEGCPADQETFEVKIISIPSPPTLYIPNGDRFCEDGNVEVETDDVGKQYEWYKDGNLIPDDTLRKLTIDTGGDYYVIAVNDQCKSDVSNTANIFEITNIPVLVDDQSVVQAPYFENFEDSAGWTINNEWIVAQETYSSASDWFLSVPNSDPSSYINSTPYTTNPTPNQKIWWTGKNSVHSSNQKSWVISPCFDFSNYGDTAAQPVMAVSVLLDAAENQNGLALQVRTNDYEEWRTIGNGNNDILGRDWYDTRNITSFPIDESGGWSGYYNISGNGGWRIARYPLESLNGEKGVRFRMVFRADNNLNGFDEGAAFDNFWIGERYNPSLIEQVIDLDNITARSDTKDLYETLDEDPENWIHLQYHLDDPIFNDGTTDKGANNARALYYGYDVFNLGDTKGVLNGDHDKDITAWLTSPFSSSNDMFSNLLTMSDYSLTKLEVEKTVNSLEPAIFQIAPIRVEMQGPNLNIRTSIHLRDSSSLPLDEARLSQIRQAIDDDKVVVRAVVVEKEVINVAPNSVLDTLRNVVRTMLPNHAGQLLKNNGSHFSFSWTPNITNLANIDIAIFVQNIDNNEIYMARANSQHFVSTNNVIDDDKNAMQVFPNPASHYFDVSLDMEIKTQAQWFIYDINGRIVRSGNLPRNVQRLRYDTSDLPSGVYLFSIQTTEGKLQPKRIVIAK